MRELHLVQPTGDARRRPILRRSEKHHLKKMRNCASGSGVRTDRDELSTIKKATCGNDCVCRPLKALSTHPFGCTYQSDALRVNRPAAHMDPIASPGGAADHEAAI